MRMQSSQEEEGSKEESRQKEKEEVTGSFRQVDKKPRVKKRGFLSNKRSMYGII